MESQQSHNARTRLALQATSGPAGPETMHLAWTHQSGRATGFSAGARHGRPRAATAVQGQYPDDQAGRLYPALGAGDGGPIQGRSAQGQVPGLLLLAEGRGSRLRSSGVSAVSLSTLPVGDSAPCRPRQRADSNQTAPNRVRQRSKPMRLSSRSFSPLLSVVPDHGRPGGSHQYRPGGGAGRRRPQA